MPVFFSLAFGPCSWGGLTGETRITLVSSCLAQPEPAQEMGLAAGWEQSLRPTLPFRPSPSAGAAVRTVGILGMGPNPQLHLEHVCSLLLIPVLCISLGGQLSLAFFSLDFSLLLLSLFSAGLDFSLSPGLFVSLSSCLPWVLSFVNFLFLSFSPSIPP